MKSLCTAILIFCLYLSGSAFASIGKITQAEGPSTITRDTGELQGSTGVGILSMDKVQTFKGKQVINFIDETKLELESHSRVIIDEFVFDPANDIGSMSIKTGLGTVRYASGQIAKKYKQNVKIQTPTAVIGVRGTDFTMTVDETGNSMIILLPSCDSNGNCFVGEITVDSDVGQVILNQAFQVTVVPTAENKPMNPLILDIDESLINNLLIISKPKEIDKELQAQDLEQVADILDIDFLKFNDLEIDYLEDEEDTEVAELDFDFLLQNFLQDVLDALNIQLAKELADQQKKPTTQIASDETIGLQVATEPTYLIIKQDEQNYIQLRLDKDYGYEITLKQNGIGLDRGLLQNGGSNINISQSN